MAVSVSAGNSNDIKHATPLLQQARYTNSRFRPEHVICDAGYSSDALRRSIKQQYWSNPMIDPNPTHKRAVAKYPKTPEWNRIYKRRTAIERLNARLKGFYKLNNVRVRGHMKLGLHALMSSLVLLAGAIVQPDACRARLA